MAEARDVETLKRRGRRRLVGAVALVLLAVIVLPMVFDQQPERSPPPVSVRIPGQGEAGVLKPLPAVPKATPAVPAGHSVTPTKPRATATEAAANPRATAKAEAAAERAAAEAKAKAEAKAEAKAKAEADAEAKAKAERTRAEAALEGRQFAVQVAALAERSSVRRLVARLKAAKLPYYTEPVATAKGTVTRVRAGPFASRAVAVRARDRLRRLGFKPGEVFPK